MQIRAGSREGTHAHCVFHACPSGHFDRRGQNNFMVGLPTVVREKQGFDVKKPYGDQ